jgi:predicted ribosome quality control (RQC) complex YloA/Tae2 family protein
VKKPRGYYFADKPTSEEEQRLKAAAIDGKTIFQLSNQPWPGCALPWKVRHISAAGLRKEVLVGHPPQLAVVDETEHKRTRKGKKTRIAIRKKTQATKDKREEQAKAAQQKEEAEREKRTRRNREKKLKKKAKSQAKKLEDADGTAEQDEASPDDSMQDD